MSNVHWLYRPRPRIKRAATPVSALHAMSQFVREPTLTASDIQKLAHDADEATMALERLADRCRQLGQITAAASYRKLADDAHLVASRIEAPALQEL